MQRLCTLLSLFELYHCVTTSSYLHADLVQSIVWLKPICTLCLSCALSCPLPHVTAQPLHVSAVKVQACHDAGVKPQPTWWHTLQEFSLFDRTGAVKAGDASNSFGNIAPDISLTNPVQTRFISTAEAGQADPLPRQETQPGSLSGWPQASGRGLDCIGHVPQGPDNAQVSSHPASLLYADRSQHQQQLQHQQ